MIIDNCSAHCSQLFNIDIAQKRVFIDFTVIEQRRLFKLYLDKNLTAMIGRLKAEFHKSANDT